MNPSMLSALQVAIREYHHKVREIPGAVHDSRILEYHNATTLGATEDELPWCASFVCWCLESVWIQSPRSARARDFEVWGDPVGESYPGCVAVLSRGSNQNQGHVGFYLESSPWGVMILGGNQGNRISIETFPSERLITLRELDVRESFPRGGAA